MSRLAPTVPHPFIVFGKHGGAAVDRLGNDQRAQPRRTDPAIVAMMAELGESTRF